MLENKLTKKYVIATQKILNYVSVRIRHVNSIHCAHKLQNSKIKLSRDYFCTAVTTIYTLQYII